MNNKNNLKLIFLTFDIDHYKLSKTVLKAHVTKERLLNIYLTKTVDDVKT